MRVALCTTFFVGPVSGADEVLVNYATHLHDAGEDVTVVLLYPSGPGDQYAPRLREAGVDVAVVVERSLLMGLIYGARRLFGFLRDREARPFRRVWQLVMRVLLRIHARRCRDYLETERPDVMHIFKPDAGTGLMIRTGHALGIPVLYHEMGTPQHMPMLGPHYERLEGVLPLCSDVAALSPRLALQWRKRFPFLEPLTVLPLLMEDFEGGPAPTGASGADDTVFGFAARVEEGKGPVVLLEALAELNRERRVGAARLAGTGPQRAEAEERAAELGLGGACQFVGAYTKPLGISEFMRGLDVFVHPSLAEGTPNSVIEAMAHGLPVVATDVGGTPDLLTSDCGILVPAGDSAALAEAMRRLADDADLRERMGRASRARYLELFAPEAVLPLLRETYGRLASAATPERAAARHPWEPAAAGSWPA